jgi:hypothetical protein
VLVVVVALLVLAGGYILVRRGSVERRLRALREAGYPTSFAELAEYNRLPEGAENAADLYMDAFTAYSRPVNGANLPVVGSAKLPPTGSRWPEPMVEAVSACLARNAGCLILLRRAGDVVQCRYEWDYAAGGFPALKELRYCVKLLELAVVAHAQKGETAAGLACIEDELRLGDSLKNEPGLICYLVRIACYGVAMRGLERVLSVTELTDEQLQEWDERLAAVGDSVDLGEVLVAERACMIEWCKDPTLLGGAGGELILMKTPGLRTVTLHDSLDYMADYIEATRLPPPERLVRFAEISEHARGRSLLHAISAMMLPALTRVAQLDVRRQAHLELARTALAIERYRLATGDVPGQLEQLVPDYLDAVPIDPFDGQPIRYRRTDPGYVLYSVFEDGQDNGGRSRDDVKRDEPHDWPFVVTR